MPDEASTTGRPGLVWKLVVAFVIGAVVSGVVVALIVHKSTPAKKPAGSTSVIAMADAKAVSCGDAVAPGPGHPDPLLSQIFTVTAGATPYQLGWSIVPFSGSSRTYRFGTGANLLALEPPTGGIPVGFGTGSITFGVSPDAGTVNAVIKLKTGRRLTLTGHWSCIVAPTGASTTTTPVISPPA